MIKMDLLLLPNMAETLTHGLEQGEHGEETTDVIATLANISVDFEHSGKSAERKRGETDGSMKIYKVQFLMYYNATGTIGDQRYA